MITCTKRFANFPFAHRQPNHEGHCSLIHGHNWSFEFTFACKELDENGFVVDFGDLQWLHSWLKNLFDHTLVLNETDPWLKLMMDTLARISVSEKGPILARIVTVPNCGAEGLASFVHKIVDVMISTKTEDRVQLAWVTVFEDDKNSATYGQ